MTNQFIKFLTIGLVASSMVACSDDDGPKGEEGGIEAVNPAQVFTQGLPKSYDGYSVKTNDKGQVTEVKGQYETATFEYTKGSRADYDMIIKLFENGESTPESIFYCLLNKQGFISSAVQVYSDPEDSDDTWSFEYNNDKQLCKMVRSEGGNEVTTITYVNGDITKVDVVDDDGDTDDATITNSNIANTCGIMLFDNCYGIDMDEMAVAYIAGLLGKSTKNLPAKLNWGGEGYDTFEWTVVDGKVTKMISYYHHGSDKYQDNTYDFVW